MWSDVLRSRLETFRGPCDGIAYSIKFHVISGCFHREHSPEAFKIIDRDYRKTSECQIEEHETGPEILVLGLITAGVILAKSVIELTTTIIKARSEGLKMGDDRDGALELIVRGFDTNGTLVEERVMRINTDDNVTRAAVEKALGLGVQKLLPPSEQTRDGQSAIPTPKRKK